MKDGLQIDELLKSSSESETDEYIERHKRQKALEKMN